jgi:hypothetical protein
MAMPARVTFLSREATGEQLIERQVRGRAAGDARQYAGVFAPDADYVRFLGSHYKGREPTVNGCLPPRRTPRIVGWPKRFKYLRFTHGAAVWQRSISYSRHSLTGLSSPGSQRHSDGPRAAVMVRNYTDVRWWQHSGNTSKPELSCATDDYRMIPQRGSAVRVIQGHVNNL